MPHSSLNIKWYLIELTFLNNHCRDNTLNEWKNIIDPMVKCEKVRLAHVRPFIFVAHFIQSYNCHSMNNWHSNNCIKLFANRKKKTKTKCRYIFKNNWCPYHLDAHISEEKRSSRYVVDDVVVWQLAYCFQSVSILLFSLFSQLCMCVMH